MICFLVEEFLDQVHLVLLVVVVVEVLIQIIAISVLAVMEQVLLDQEEMVAMHAQISKMSSDTHLKLMDLLDSLVARPLAHLHLEPGVDLVVGVVVVHLVAVLLEVLLGSLVALEALVVALEALVVDYSAIWGEFWMC